MTDNTPTRRQSHLKNSLYGLFSWLFPIVPTIVVTPILVKNLGNDIYGIYVLILGFISYFFTAGIGKAAAKYVAEYRATGETGKISDIVSSTILLSVSLSIIGAGLVVIFAPYIVGEVLLISSEYQNQAILALYLACATVVIGTTAQIFQLILQGLQRFDRFLLLTNLSSILLSIGNVAAVLLGYSILAILMWTLFVGIFVGIISITQASRLLPEFKFSFRVTNEAWQAVWRYAVSIIAYQIFGNILLLFERGWIVRKFGVEALTFYAVPMMLAMYIHLFTSSLLLALFPAVNQLLSDREKLIVLYKKTSKLILVLVSFAALSAVVGGQLFLGLWMGTKFATASYFLLVIHVFTFAILAMNTVVWQVAEGFKQAVLNSIATFAWMAVSIPLMIYLSETMETSGVALARLTGVFVFIPLIYIVEKRFLGGIFWRFWASILLRISIALAITFIVEYLIVDKFPASWLTFFFSVTVGFVVYIVVLAFSGLFEDDEKQLIGNVLARFR